MTTLESKTIVLITPETEKLYSHTGGSFKRNKLTYLTPCWEKLSLINQILVLPSFASLINTLFTCISNNHGVFSLRIITWFTFGTRRVANHSILCPYYVARGYSKGNPSKCFPHELLISGNLTEP